MNGREAYEWGCSYRKEPYIPWDKLSEADQQDMERVAQEVQAYIDDEPLPTRKEMMNMNEKLPDTYENRVKVGEEVLEAASPTGIEPLPDTFYNRLKIAEQLLASTQAQTAQGDNEHAAE